MGAPGIIGTQITVNASDARLFFATAAVIIPLLFGYLFVTNRELLTPSGKVPEDERKKKQFMRRRQYAVGVIAIFLAGALSLGETLCFAQILATPTALGLRIASITMCGLFGLTSGFGLLRWIDKSAVSLAFAVGSGTVCAMILAGPGILLSMNIVGVVG